MTGLFVATDSVDASSTARRESGANARRWWFLYLALVSVGLMIGAVAFKRSEQMYLGLSAAVLLLLLASWMRYPRASLAVTVAFALIGDQVTVSWFPFTKNLSSYESILYIADPVGISPLEIVLVWGLVTTGYRRVARSQTVLQSGALTIPLLVFGVFIAGGLVTGLSRGGDLRIALFEVRPLLYLILAYILVVSVCETREDYRKIFYAALVGIVIQGVFSLNYLGQLAEEARTDLEGLNEHGSAIGQNLLFVSAVLALVLRGVPRRITWVLVASSIPVMVVYFVSQRRAAIVALGAATVLILVVLFWRQRRTFWIVTPVVVILVAGYLAAFWNADSSLGFPAQAAKSVLAPDQLSEADESSNVYRELERFNLVFTIRAEPIRGQGFGRPFFRPLPLPDISVFEFNAYLPHNSVLWVWIKTGFFGFVAMLWVFAKSLMIGAERIRKAPAGTDLVVATAAVLFVVMFAVFLFVDIGWGARNAVLVAVAMGLCTGPFLDDDEGADASLELTDRPARQVI